MKFRLSKKSILKGLEGRLGENDYLEPLEHLIESFKNESRLNLAGNLGVRHQLINRLKVRAQLHDFIEDKNAVIPEDAVMQLNLRETTTKILSTLTPREERVLRMRFGVGMNTDHTLEEVLTNCLCSFFTHDPIESDNTSERALGIARQCVFPCGNLTIGD